MGNSGNNILALDAGFVATGWAVLRAGNIIATGCIRTEKSTKKEAARVAESLAAHLAAENGMLVRLLNGNTGGSDHAVA